MNNTATPFFSPLCPFCFHLSIVFTFCSLHSFSPPPLTFSFCSQHFSSFFALNSSIPLSYLLPPCSSPSLHPLKNRHRPRFPAHRSDVPASWQRPRGAAADRPPGLLHQHPQWRRVHPRDPRPECKSQSRGKRLYIRAIKKPHYTTRVWINTRLSFFFNTAEVWVLTLCWTYLKEYYFAL